MQRSIVAKYTGATVQFSSLSECDKLKAGIDAQCWLAITSATHVLCLHTISRIAFDPALSCALTSVGLADDAVTSGVLLGSTGWNGDWPVLGFAELQTKQVAALSPKSPRSCWSSNSTFFDTRTDQRSVTSCTKLRCFIFFTCLQYSMKALVTDRSSM